MIEISHIQYNIDSIGIAAHKMRSGPNKIQITAKNKDGKLYYPEPFRLDKELSIAKYGPITKINKNNLMGIWVPLKDVREGTVNEINNEGHTAAEEEQSPQLSDKGNGEADKPSEPSLF